MYNRQDNQQQRLDQAGQRAAQELQRQKQAEEAAQERIECIKKEALDRVTAAHKAEADRKRGELDASRKAVQETAEASMKERARALYPGTDEAFEQDWPTIRPRLMAEEAVRRDQEFKASISSMYREF